MISTYRKPWWPGRAKRYQLRCPRYIKWMPLMVCFGGRQLSCRLGSKVEIAADAGARIGGRGLLRCLGRDFPRDGGGPQSGARDLQLLSLILSGENTADYVRDFHTQYSKVGRLPGGS